MSGTTMKYTAKGSKKGFGLGKALALVLSAAVVAGGVVGWNAHTAKEARLQAEAQRPKPSPPRLRPTARSAAPSPTWWWRGWLLKA